MIRWKNRAVLLFSILLCAMLTACAGPFGPALKEIREQRAARQQTSGSSSVQATEGPSTSEEAERLIRDWMDGHPLGEDVALLENAEGSFLSDGSACFSFDLFLESEPVAILYVSKTDGTLLVGPGTEIPIDDWYEQYWMGPDSGDIYGYEGDGYGDVYQPPQIDPTLCGRWRGDDGSVLELDEYGMVNQINFRVWNDLFHTPDSITWEASNGCLTFSSRFDSSYEWTMGQQEYTDSIYDEETGEYHGENKMMDRLTLKSLDGYGGSVNYYRKDKTTGGGFVGEWELNGGGLGGPLILYADGTGSFGTNPITWYSDGEYYYQTGYQTSSIDYYVAGDLLTLYFSDGTKYLTRVGN